MRAVQTDGSPAAVERLAQALAAALTGGPPVAPVAGIGDGATSSACQSRPDPGVEAALVVQTSGSTGVARRVVLSAAALRASATATHARLGGPGRW
ncbi:MAG: AMP-dependent synthetase, partial [Actinomycetota bacterium]|nr:AMP-dependent synthetase [Actinomycetota bacterium]